MSKENLTPAQRAAQQVLRELERLGSAREAARPEAKRKRLEAGLNELARIERKTYDATRFTAEWVDEQGKRHVLNAYGVPTGFPGNSLVKSNLKGLKPRAEAARRAYYELQGLLEAHSRGQVQLPDDPDAYVSDLIASIPPGDKTLVVVQTPKLETSKPSPAKG